MCMQLSEIELLTYWSTYLYARCNKSVSYAMPCYYAHWAARRGRSLLNAGASPGDLTTLSQKWLAEHSNMYFI